MLGVSISKISHGFIDRSMVVSCVMSKVEGSSEMAVGKSMSESNTAILGMYERGGLLHISHVILT